MMATALPSSKRKTGSGPLDSVQTNGDRRVRRAVVLTALRTEFEAVKAYLDNVRETVHPKGTIYETGDFNFNSYSPWTVSVVETGAGNSSAAAEAERSIATFRPDVIMFVGVAGGIKDVSIGDVVIADKVYGYESGKAEAAYKTRPLVFNSNYALEQRARAVARSDEWLSRLEQPLVERPKAFVAPIAAGEKVVASTRSPVFQFLRKNYNDAIAVEMEGIGFLEASHINPEVHAIVIRGISDLINKKEVTDAQGSQKLAARNVSAFAFENLATYIPAQMTDWVNRVNDAAKEIIELGRFEFVGDDDIEKIFGSAHISSTMVPNPLGPVFS